MLEEEKQGLERLAQRALEGDRAALEELIQALQNDVYGLALRMLGHPADAEDASQEILIKIVTHLASFRGESALRTWAWRVACNHLLAARKGRVERSDVWLEEVVARTPSQTDSPERELLADEVMRCCARAMQRVLDRDLRVAFILGAVFELSSDEGAAILGIKPATLRKRQSRAAARLRGYLQRRCGLIDERNVCRCGEPPSAGHDASTEVQEMVDAVSLLRREEDRAPRSLLEGIQNMLSSGRIGLFQA